MLRDARLIVVALNANWYYASRNMSIAASDALKKQTLT
jgi:hypothetical protein